MLTGKLYQDFHLPKDLYVGLQHIQVLPSPSGIYVLVVILSFNIIVGLDTSSSMKSHWFILPFDFLYFLI